MHDAAGLLYTMPGNVLRCFRGRNLLWHILAAGATLIIVVSGFDGSYFEATRAVARDFFWYAVRLGWYVPVMFPVVLFIAGFALKDRREVLGACSAAQAAIIGLLISSAYKAFTGRPSPRHAAGPVIDASRVFHFGFLKGGVFFGWPSTHTTIAFAMATALSKIYSGRRAAVFASLLYAFYVGVGVSLTIHWFSDFTAGAIIGTVIGTTVGEAFKKSPPRP